MGGVNEGPKNLELIAAIQGEDAHTGPCATTANTRFGARFGVLGRGSARLGDRFGRFWAGGLVMVGWHPTCLLFPLFHLSSTAERYAYGVSAEGFGAVPIGFFEFRAPVAVKDTRPIISYLGVQPS